MIFNFGNCNDNPISNWIDVLKYRKKVFIDTLGWELECQGDLEIDQFDRSDTEYVVVYDYNRYIIGFCRLLPTTKPYLLGSVFPYLMDNDKIPNSPAVWELSRFAAHDFDKKSIEQPNQFSSEIAIELLKKAIEVASSKGAKQLITVSPLGIERLLRSAGFQSYRAGKPMKSGQHTIFANIIECCIPR